MCVFYCRQCCVLLFCCLQHLHTLRHSLLHFLSLMINHNTALFKYAMTDSKTGYCVLNLLDALYSSHRPGPWSLFQSGPPSFGIQMDGCTLLIPKTLENYTQKMSYAVVTKTFMSNKQQRLMCEAEAAGINRFSFTKRASFTTESSQNIQNLICLQQGRVLVGRKIHLMFVCFLVLFFNLSCLF